MKIAGVLEERTLVVHNDRVYKRSWVSRDKSTFAWRRTYPVAIKKGSRPEQVKKFPLDKIKEDSVEIAGNIYFIYCGMIYCRISDGDTKRVGEAGTEDSLNKELEDAFWEEFVKAYKSSDRPEWVDKAGVPEDGIPEKYLE